MRERERMLDKLVKCGKTLQELSATDETIRGEIRLLDHRVRDSIREVHLQLELRQRLSLRKASILADRKKIATQLSQTREQISQTKKRLWE